MLRLAVLRGTDAEYIRPRRSYRAEHTTLCHYYIQIQYTQVAAAHAACDGRCPETPDGFTSGRKSQNSNVELEARRRRVANNASCYGFNKARTAVRPSMPILLKRTTKILAGVESVAATCRAFPWKDGARRRARNVYGNYGELPP